MTPLDVYVSVTCLGLVTVALLFIAVGLKGE